MRGYIGHVCLFCRGTHFTPYDQMIQVCGKNNRGCVKGCNLLACGGKDTPAHINAGVYWACVSVLSGHIFYSV